ncbi:MAG: tetratricopeptide repeat protein, partial [Pseudomonadota bacterium]
MNKNQIHKQNEQAVLRGILKQQKYPVGTAIAAALLTTACAMTPESLGIPASLAPSPESGAMETGSITTSSLAPASTSTPQSTSGVHAAGETLSGPEQILDEAGRLRALGRATEAMALLDDKTKTTAATPAMRLSHGLLALETGDLAKAKSILKKAEKTDPPNWRVLSGLGAVHAAEGNQSEAQKALAKALRLNPDHPSILNNLALSYALDGKRDRAETILRRAAA